MIDAFSRTINRLGKENRQLHRRGVYFVSTRESGNCMRQ
jgi:hypothetical protein